MPGDIDECCSDQTVGITWLYTELATSPNKSFGWATGKENAVELGYDERWLCALPDEIWESDAAVGYPFGLGDIMPGQTIVDLGCGAGADLCIAGLLCGAHGRAIGIDITPAMVEKSRANAALLNLDCVEVFEADFSSLPLFDGIADTVISNGSINLAPAKLSVFREAYRVLKPGGRFQFADMVKDGNAVSEGQEMRSSWADCVSGTLTPGEYLEMLIDAGFAAPELIGFTSYKTAETTIGALFRSVKE